ncbi:hypothetical protein P3G55_24085 [Leptospira sp. 96542]|nr:hypothetical protein [Leptospira sp. 96542]
MKKFLKFLMISQIIYANCISTSNKISSPARTSVPKIFEEFAPPLQTFWINPDTDQTFETKNGAFISIPKNSFKLPYFYKKGTLVQINYKEYKYTLDYLSSGISLSVIENNNPISLDSAGMFEIKALYENSEIPLRNPIQIKIQNIYPGTPYNLYKVINNEWVLAGKNSQIAQERTPRTDLPFAISQNKRDKNIINYREYTKIDSLTTWNFDIPIENTCLSLNLPNIKLSESNNLFYSVYSTTKLRINFKWSSNTKLNIMVPTNDIISIIFWYENSVSIIKGIQTPSAPLGDGKILSEENCLNKGDQILNFQSEELLKDKTQRNQYLFGK